MSSRIPVIRSSLPISPSSKVTYVQSGTTAVNAKFGAIDRSNDGVTSWLESNVAPVKVCGLASDSNASTPRCVFFKKGGPATPIPRVTHHEVIAAIPMPESQRATYMPRGVPAGVVPYLVEDAAPLVCRPPAPSVAVASSTYPASNKQRVSGLASKTTPVPQTRQTNLVQSLSASLQPATNRAKRDRLRNMKVFVLDNSLRESTVGQVAGQTVEDKLKIIDHVKSCGFKHIIAGAFSFDKRPDDVFVNALVERGEDLTNFWGFSEVVDGKLLHELLGLSASRHDLGPDCVPIGLQKMMTLNIPNAILEFDFANQDVDYDHRFNVITQMYMFLLKTHKQKFPNGRILLNIRDLAVAMCVSPVRVLSFVEWVANTPSDVRPMGIIFEEPMGIYFPDELGRMASAVRKVMDAYGWTSDGETTGLLLVHIHKQWGLADAAVLDVLAQGGDGIWCSLCEDGASVGHSCSVVILSNLARCGNKDVRQRYVTRNLATAARAVAEITTGEKVNARQIVYGPRAIEVVFDFAGVGGSRVFGSIDYEDDGVIDDVDKFDLADFFGIQEPLVRLSSLASPAMIVAALKRHFGEDPTFNEVLGSKMHRQIEKDLRNDRKEEYTSKVGLAKLYASVTGTLTSGMKEKLGNRTIHDPFEQQLMASAQQIFMKLSDDGNTVKHSTFFDGIAQHFFACFSCKETYEVFSMIDTDHDSLICWNEWSFWLLWALREHRAEIKDVDDLHICVFRRGLLPLFLKKSKNNATRENRKSKGRTWNGESEENRLNST